MQSKKVQTGLDRLKDEAVSGMITGNIGYLCHAASIDSEITHGINVLKQVFGDRLKKIFSPQHGLFGDLQDNMIESDHFFHPYFKLPVYSLYSETRSPTAEMLEGLDCLIIDLQDVGTRVYTYIWTIILSMQSAGKKGIKVYVLDRPNPIGGNQTESNLLAPEYSSFVGLHPLTMRHGLTVGEIASMAKSWGIDCDLTVIEMVNWNRKMYFDQTGLPWVMPSPNLPSLETAIVYPGTVIYEGTNLSEGRGTTRSLEIIGHPSIEPFSLHQKLIHVFKDCDLKGFVLRPLVFMPTFHKHKEQVCGGFQIHCTNRKTFQPWKTSMVLCRELFHHLEDHFIWKTPPYEYEFTKIPFDILNGTDLARKWVEKNGDYQELLELDSNSDFHESRKEFFIYQ